MQSNDVVQTLSKASALFTLTFSFFFLRHIPQRLSYWLAGRSSFIITPPPVILFTANGIFTKIQSAYVSSHRGSPWPQLSFSSLMPCSCFVCVPTTILNTFPCGRPCSNSSIVQKLLFLFYIGSMERFSYLCRVTQLVNVRQSWDSNHMYWLRSLQSCPLLYVVSLS